MKRSSPFTGTVESFSLFPFSQRFDWIWWNEALDTYATTNEIIYQWSRQNKFLFKIFFHNFYVVKLSSLIFQKIWNITMEANSVPPELLTKAFHRDLVSFYFLNAPLVCLFLVSLSNNTNTIFTTN